jgi:RNA polymerase sigma factor (sigma-70 family)
MARKIRTIRKPQAVSSWLHGVAYRLALKARTRRSRRQDREKSAPPSSAASPVDDLTVRELGSILHAELQRLPDAYRAALLLCYWEGKTRDEAADQLGMTASVFKKRLERARSMLGNRLARRGLVPSVALLAMLFAEHGAKGALSTLLVQGTAEAAVAYAAGKSATTLASAAAVVLAEGAIRTMNATKWVTTLLLGILLCTLGTTLAVVSYQALAGQRSDPLAQAAGAAGQGQVQGQAKQKSDAERFLGTWRITKGLAKGKELPRDFIALGRLTFTKDGKVTLSVVEEGPPGNYKLIGPGKIDIALNPQGELGEGIYKFDGDDRLTLCVAQHDGDKKRPTKFSGEADSGQALFTLTRAKPGEEKARPEEIAKFADAAGKVQEAIARTQSAANLKQIGKAMQDYVADHKTLPAHAIYSKDGKTPLLSWRVAILPYLDQKALYEEFKLDEPWDSAHNKKLIEKMPKVFEINRGEKGDGLTYYQVFTGPDTVFDGQKKMRPADITDGTSNTLLALEARQPVIWSRPADLVLPREKDRMPPVGGLFTNGFNVVLCDGSVIFMVRDPQPKLLRSLVTPRGND